MRHFPHPQVRLYTPLLSSIFYSSPFLHSLISCLCLGSAVMDAIPVDEGPVEEGEISEARDHAPEELATAEFVVPSYSPGMISEFHFIVFFTHAYSFMSFHALLYQM